MIERTHSGTGMPFPGKASVCLLLAFAVLAITLFICSPWHEHNRFTMRICEFSQFEHGSLNGPADHIYVAPPVLAGLGAPVEVVFASLSSRAVEIVGPRAPPAPVL